MAIIWPTAAALTHQPATDLGYLLHKHPDRAQEFKQSFGHRHRLLPRSHRRTVHGRADAEHFAIVPFKKKRNAAQRDFCRGTTKTSSPPRLTPSMFSTTSLGPDFGGDCPPLSSS